MSWVRVESPGLSYEWESSHPEKMSRAQPCSPLSGFNPSPRSVQLLHIMVPLDDAKATHSDTPPTVDSPPPRVSFCIGLVGEPLPMFNWGLPITLWALPITDVIIRIFGIPALQKGKCQFFFFTKSERRKPQLWTQLPKSEHNDKCGTCKDPVKSVSPTNNFHKTTPPPPPPPPHTHLSGGVWPDRYSRRSGHWSSSSSASRRWRLQ